MLVKMFCFIISNTQVTEQSVTCTAQETLLASGCQIKFPQKTKSHPVKIHEAVNIYIRVVKREKAQNVFKNSISFAQHGNQPQHEYMLLVPEETLFRDRLS